MSLTLTTNPVTGTRKIFAGFQPIEFIFKREDIAITSVTSGVDDQAKINHTGDLTSYLAVGDTVYLYSEGTGYTYDFTAAIVAIVAGEITIDAPYIVSGSGGYMNYFKNYYVELQCVNKTLPLVNLLGFSLEADGDAAGNVVIDVSIMNDLNSQRGDLAQELISDSMQEFEIKYRQVYSGSAESFTLVDDKLLIVLYATEDPEEEVILNQFDLPKLYLGYPSGIVVAHKAAAAGVNIDMNYVEQNINSVAIASDTIGQLAGDVSGYLMWLWPSSASVQQQTKYIEFEFAYEATFDFAATDFDYPDFYTQEP